ncbi:MAG: SH3 domain-containing protein [Lachnospiraceae bacterium]|nr:SH3 domain-containing protein [Lachnospiraceae bacterium]
MMFGASLADEAFAIHTQDNKELWNTIQAEDVAFYSYDNNLGLGMIVDKNSDTISLPSVSFSKEGTHTMYVQEDANVRSAGTTVATAFDGIAKGDEITVNGMANGWGRVIADGRTGYISASLLGDTKPAKEVKEEKKAEKAKKAEKVETEGAHAATGYTVGRIEAYNGNSVTINGIKAVIGFDTAITGGEIRVGDLAKLEYWTAADGQINAKCLHTQGSPEEGLAIASDGRVAYTGEQAEEQTVAQASDGRVAYTGEQTTEQAEEQTAEQAVEQTTEESHETAEAPAAEHAEEAPAAEETFDEIG